MDISSIFSSLGDTISGFGGLFDDVGGAIGSFDDAFGTDVGVDISGGESSTTGTSTSPQQPPLVDDSQFGNKFFDAIPQEAFFVGALGVLVIVAALALKR